MNVQCHPCGIAMSLTFQAKDEEGIDTFVFHCPECSGSVAVQEEDAKAPELRPIRPLAQNEIEIEISRAPMSAQEARASSQPFATIGPDPQVAAPSSAQDIAKILLKP
jgi:hypothetical protein